MKRMCLDPQHRSTKLTCCTVSAAALMLGVSQAATVGINFQANYCAAQSYSGAVVTAPAFGIGTNAWQSLTPMFTGYQSTPPLTGCDPGYYTFNEMINTTTSGGGLNPLPNGALQITWSGYTANVSGFGGYDRPGPHYTFGGNGYNPGNEQVYWGFLRDGVNFGPGSSGGDNNQPGYSIDITGLKTLFTNTPFAVELIASADSMQYLTNAFVIDATLGTTQSVMYPSTPPVTDANDTSWIRGIGGGLSTATANPINTDHLKIIGNRAAHVGPKTGYNFASTIAGFIITDKPVVSMPPNSVLVSPSDTVTLSGYAVGVPPLAYQWRKNGQLIAQATTTMVQFPAHSLGDGGNYDLVVTNLYGSVTSSVAVVTIDKITPTAGRNFIVDSNPQNVERDGLDRGATWLASSIDSLRTNRTGVMSYNAAATNQIQVPTGTSFNSPTGTVMFWMRTSGLANPAGNRATLVDRRNGKGGAGFVLALGADGSLQFESDNQSNPFGVGTVADGNWHHIALTYDQSSGGLETIYIDGVANPSGPNTTAWSWNVGQDLDLGASSDTADWQPYNGLMDDVRVYDRILIDTEITSAYSGALVDTTALLLRFNFDAPPSSGVTLRWQCPDAILQMSPTVNGSYTDLPNVTSPYPVAARTAAKFFRYRGHTSTNVVSNPYLM